MVDRDEARHAPRGPIASLHPVFTRDGDLDPDGIGRCVEHVLGAGTRTVLLTYGDPLHDAELDELRAFMAGAGMLPSSAP